MMGFLNYNAFFGFPFGINMWFWGMLMLLWILPWKGYALWLAARKGHQGWFVALLILNTMAILDILYILVFSEPAKPLKIKEKVKK